MAEAGILVRPLLLEVDVLLTSSRPPEFVKQSAYPEDSDEEESIVGKMPPMHDSNDET